MLNACLIRIIVKYCRVSFETLNTASLPDQNGLIISVKRSFVNRRPSQRRSMRVRTLVY